MTLFPSWGNFGRLDDIGQNTNEITLYRDNQPILSTERGVSLGLLKLIYSSEPNNGYNGILLGVKPREEPLHKPITSDSAVLDKDEYDVIVQDPFVQPFPTGYLTIPLQTPKQNPTAEQLLQHQLNNAYNINQNILQAASAIPPSSTQFFSQLIPNVLQQTVQSLPAFSSTIGRSAASIIDNFIPMPTSAADASTISLQSSSSVPASTTEPVSDHSAQKTAEPIPANQPSNRPPPNLSGAKNDAAAIEKPPEQDGTVTEGNYIDTAKYPYQCEVCHIPFKSKSKFIHHKRRHTEENPYLCTYCNESFKHFFELSKHRDELHLCNKSFKCGQCPKSFSTRKELKHHMWRHTGEKMHKCDICSKQYSSAGNLSLHMQKHNGIKPFKCPLCPKMFSHKSVLENHIRSGHTGEKPFICRFCDKAFPNNSQLSSHLKRHSDLKPHTCKVCGKGFRQSHLLKRHSILHTSERPYKCHICPKTFRESSNLQYHMTTHQEKADRLVICPFCEKGVIVGRGIRRHLKIHHSDKCSTEEEIESLAKSLKPDKEKTEHHLKEMAERNQGKLPCPECSKKCKTLTGLKKHVSTEHSFRQLTAEEIKKLPDSAWNTDSNSVSCQFCYKQFKSQHRLKNHFMIMHPDQAESLGLCQNDSEIFKAKKQTRRKNKICKQCGKVFFMQSSLKSHVVKDHASEMNSGNPLDGESSEINSQIQQINYELSSTDTGENDKCQAVGIVCSAPDEILDTFLSSEKDENTILKVNRNDCDTKGCEKSPSSQTKVKKSLVCCTLCQRKFCSVKTLANHMALCHKEVKSILIDANSKGSRKQCQFCVVSFAHAATLKRHVDKVHAHLNSPKVDNAKSLEVKTAEVSKYKLRSIEKQTKEETLFVRDLQVKESSEVKGSGNVIDRIINSAAKQCKAISTADSSVAVAEGSNDSRLNPLQPPQTASSSPSEETIGENGAKKLDDEVVDKIIVEAQSTERGQILAAQDITSSSSPCEKFQETENSFEIISSTFDIITDEELAMIPDLHDQQFADVAKIKPDHKIYNINKTTGSDRNKKFTKDVIEKSKNEKQEKTGLLGKGIGLPVISTSKFLKLHVGDLKSKTVTVDKFPILAPNALMKPPPPGYSYAYLPVLVPNDENTSAKEDTLNS